MFSKNMFNEIKKNLFLFSMSINIFNFSSDNKNSLKRENPFIGHDKNLYGGAVEIIPINIYSYDGDELYNIKNEFKFFEISPSKDDKNKRTPEFGKINSNIPDNNKSKIIFTSKKKPSDLNNLLTIKKENKRKCNKDYDEIINNNNNNNNLRLSTDAAIYNYVNFEFNKIKPSQIKYIEDLMKSPNFKKNIN